MTGCLIGLGSNLGDRRQHLDEAAGQLSRRDDVQLLQQSRWMESLPLGGPGEQGTFLNGAIRLETPLSPHALLNVLQEIENQSGRRREQRWAARELDLDLLLFGHEIIRDELLTVPHPRMIYRRFVLEPAREIAEDMLHPTTGWTIARLLEHLNDATPYLALGGGSPAARSRLAREILSRTPGSLAPDPNPDPQPPTDAAAWVESIRQCGKLLDPNARPNPGALVVSDFWLDEKQLAATLRLDEPALESVRDAWTDARNQAAPKLTIVLQHSETAPPPRPDGNTQTGDADFSLRLAGALNAYLAQPGLGPILEVNADREDVLLQESLAAAEGIC
ncbi:MAG: 2-amino-4-hydroxy-6-hydroxymethyldihydropteridine diphosphokinase [Planctomycetales bacterium]